MMERSRSKHHHHHHHCVGSNVREREGREAVDGNKLGGNREEPYMVVLLTSVTELMGFSSDHGYVR